MNAFEQLLTEPKYREIAAKYFNDCNPNEIKIV